jgi:PAS domain S-box-containing protein
MAATNIRGFRNLKIPIARKLEQLPSTLRALLGVCAAALPLAISYGIAPLRTFPLLLAIPTVILACWFLDLAGGLVCALTDAVLVELYLTSAQTRFLLGDIGEVLRMPLFIITSVSIGWALRRLAVQRNEIERQELQQQLILADAERRLAEERAHATEALRDRDQMLRISLEANGMGFWVWDLQHGRVYWSDEMFRLGGREPGSVEPTFEAWIELILEEDQARVVEARKQTCETGKDYHEQYRVCWRDGSVHWIESQGKCLRDDEGKVLRVVGVLADVTPRRRAEEAMLRAEKLAVAGRLAASVAHEINNPLEAVSNLLFLITLTDATDVAKQHAQAALDQLMRVSMITQQTLKFHRQSGSPMTTRLSDVVETVKALFQARLAANEITLQIQAKDEREVNCMPSEAQQIFANLMSNAIEATPRGGRILVRLKPSHHWSNGAPGMRVTFADSGTGVDRATIRRMFEPFFTTKTETGTGLGLWVVAQLVDRHNGQICVYSRQRGGQSGTVFSVFLPLNHENVAAHSSALRLAKVRELSVKA